MGLLHQKDNKTATILHFSFDKPEGKQFDRGKCM